MSHSLGVRLAGQLTVHVLRESCDEGGHHPHHQPDEDAGHHHHHKLSQGQERLQGEREMREGVRR